MVWFLNSTSNIATNTSNIATNTTDIDTNKINITSNTSNIATNTPDIDTNKINITPFATLADIHSRTAAGGDESQRCVEAADVRPQTKRVGVFARPAGEVGRGEPVASGKYGLPPPPP